MCQFPSLLFPSMHDFRKMLLRNQVPVFVAIFYKRNDYGNTPSVSTRAPSYIRTTPNPLPFRHPTAPHSLLPFSLTASNCISTIYVISQHPSHIHHSPSKRRHCLPMVQRMLLPQRDRLLHQQTAPPMVQDILDDMAIPMQPSVVEMIMDSAGRIVRDRRSTSNWVMPIIQVCINVHDTPRLADGEEEEEEDYYDDDDDDDDDNYDGKNDGSSSSTLEIVMVEECGRQCAICLDEFEMSCEATCMACSHIYHHQCIRKWLEREQVCPVCRFQIT